MGLKSILCIFEGSQTELNAASTAVFLAKIFEGQVRFLHISHDTTAYGNLYDEGMFISVEMVTYLENTNQKRLDTAKQYIETLCAEHQLPLDHEHPPLHHAYAQFLQHTGDAESIIAKEGRASDIVIIGRGIEPDILYDDALLAAIFNTGKQVLLVPSADVNLTKKWNEKVISVAWDGSIEAARAIYNSLPILRRAEKINILTARDHEKNETINFNKPLANYLSAHEIHPNYIELDCKKHNAGDVILTKAKELESDLLIMGAYGHSHFREMIMGGFTKYMLENADLPLLLSH